MVNSFYTDYNWQTNRPIVLVYDVRSHAHSGFHQSIYVIDEEEK